MGKCTERLYNGIVKENPTFVQMLGMCPTLAVTSSAINGAGMGFATTCILVMSNAVISLLRKVIPDKVRIPSYIVVIASFVTIIQFLMEAYLPSLNSSLGIYIPLIVVNCIILGRAESYASKNKVLPSIFDGIGMGLGFTIGLTTIGAFRELIGKGSIFDVQLLGDGNIFENMNGAAGAIGSLLSGYTPVTIFVLAPGAFFVLAFLTAFLNKRNAVKKAKAAACAEDACAACAGAAICGKGDVKKEEKTSETSDEKKDAKASDDKKPEEKSDEDNSKDKKSEDKSGEDASGKSDDKKLDAQSENTSTETKSEQKTDTTAGNETKDTTPEPEAKIIIPASIDKKKIKRANVISVVESDQETKADS